jgi:hypothetical protein
MADTHVISALVSKRAELSGELIAAEKRIEKLRADLEHIDGAIRVFDPAAVPVKIRPRKPLSVPLTSLPHGQASRFILGILREATEPMTARQIADTLAERCGIAEPSPSQQKAMLTKVRNMLARQDGRGLIREERKDGAVWRVA